MAKNYLEKAGRIALFRTRESEPGSASTSSGFCLDFDSGSEIKSALAVEHDGDTIHGSELPMKLHGSNREAKGKLSQKRAKPDFVAFVLAYFFGECVSTGTGATAFEHTISPVADLELPSFTAILRRGADVFTERLSGNYIESFNLELADGWVSCGADVVGTGHREVNYERETVSAPANAESITLAENAVEGGTDAERKKNVYRVRAKDTGSEAWTTLGVSAVSGATPAVIDFAAALGAGTGNVDYEVDYLPAEPDWCALPDFVDESPLKLVDARVVVDGHFNGSELEGGEELKAEVMGFAVAGKNNLEVRHFPGESGPGAAAVRGGRELTISLTESLRDTIRLYQADHPETEEVAVALVVRGAEIDAGSGVYFGAELIFPRCGILAAPVVVQGGRLASAGDLVVLDDGEYGGVVVRCYNRQNTYLGE